MKRSIGCFRTDLPYNTKWMEELRYIASLGVGDYVVGVKLVKRNILLSLDSVFICAFNDRRTA